MSDDIEWGKSECRTERVKGELEGGDIFFLKIPSPTKAYGHPNLDYPRIMKKINLAKSYCNSCAIKSECLEYGMSQQHGMYGGLTPEERKKLRRERRMGNAS